jgi:hypothetical protein
MPSNKIEMVLPKIDYAFYPIIKSGRAGSFCWDWDTPYRESYNIITDLRKNVPNGDYVPIDPM